jgi:hypothetical protein
LVDAGLIITNSITQTPNRAGIAAKAERRARVCRAIWDRVWYDGADGTEVRIAMTVIAKNPIAARLLTGGKVERVHGAVPVVAEIHTGEEGSRELVDKKACCERGRQLIRE